MAQLLLACVASVLEDDTIGALRCLDHAFIFGGPTEVYRQCIEVLGTSPEALVEVTAVTAPPAARCQAAQLTLDEAQKLAGQWACSREGLTAFSPVERWACNRAAPTAAAAAAAAKAEPSLLSSTAAVSEARRRGRPLVLEHVTDEWVAMSKWADFDWWRRAHGERLVPVEVQPHTCTLARHAQWASPYAIFAHVYGRTLFMHMRRPRPYAWARCAGRLTGGRQA